MNLEIVRIADRGVETKERLVLRALADINLEDYIVFDTTFVDEDEISNKLRHSYWFESKEVSARDLVVVYTKPGEASERRNQSGTRTHFFYWNLGRTLWNKSGDCALLVHIDSWQASRFE